MLRTVYKMTQSQPLRFPSPNREALDRNASTATIEAEKPQSTLLLPGLLRPKTLDEKLWTPGDGSLHRVLGHDCFAGHGYLDGSQEEIGIALIKQPKTRLVTNEQLVAEVKGIYAGLVMVESKCIEVINAQSSQIDAELNDEQWQALIALHRTLLHEYHDFFLASQHPSASP
ncbi:hypothetical protein JX266_014300, partial [Neoarthrinium moseri]